MKIAHAEAAAVAEVKAVAIDWPSRLPSLLKEKVQGDLASELVSKGVVEVKERFR